MLLFPRSTRCLRRQVPWLSAEQDLRYSSVTRTLTYHCVFRRYRYGSMYERVLGSEGSCALQSGCCNEEEIMTGIRQRAGGMTRMQAGLSALLTQTRQRPVERNVCSGLTCALTVSRLCHIHASNTISCSAHLSLYYPSRLTRYLHICILMTIRELFHGVVKMLTNFRFTDLDAEPIASINFMDRKYAHLLAGRHHLRSPTPTPNGSCIIPFAGKPTW